MYDHIKNKIIQYILENPLSCLAFGLFLFFSSLIGLKNFKSNFTPRIWFGPESQYIKNVDLFEKTFGSDQFIALGMHRSNGVNDQRSFEIIKELSDRLWFLPDIVRVESLSTYNYITSKEGEIIIEPLILPELSVDEINKRIDSSKELDDFFISTDRKLTIFQLQIKPYFDQTPDYTKIMRELVNVTKPYLAEGFQFQELGSAAVTYAFRSTARNDNRQIIPVLFIIILVMLGFYFKSINGVMIPFIVSIVTIGSTLGLMGVFNYSFNSILGAIPGIILAICLADTIHLITTFCLRLDTGESIKDSLKYSMNKNFLATILTSVTTALSFFTIANTELVPIHDLGILSGIGCILAWIYTYLFLPPMILLFPKKFNRPLKEEESNHRFSLKKWPSFIIRFKRPIIIVFSVISILAIWASFYNEVNSDPVNYFSNKTKLRKDFDFVKKHIKGIRSVDFVIDSGEIDGVKNPDFLKRVDQFIIELLSDKEIIQINSLLDAIKKVNAQIEGEGEEVIPKNREQVAAVLLLYQMGLPASLGIENQMSVDGKQLRLRIKWSAETTRDAIRKENDILRVAKKYNLNAYSGGYFPIYTKMNDKVVESFFKSMATAIFLVSLIIFLVFKDFKISLLAMLPNVIPLAVGAAFMAIFDIYIDIGTSIVSAICLGIAVDDTIHFIVHFLKNKKESGSSEGALIVTFQGTGKALVMTTVLLVLGFGSFIFADFLPNRYFGFLCALVLSFALITDLLFLPAIMIERKSRK